ncbi:unnamed protein product [Heligmosomoides polygyrus]|uniref:Nuclear receptor domain-containing protein n=1 Tax=Heligmosomoides polygyrus TaxID=6339 RepID=A0A183FJ81_HELPZ|nr:unnamed protein product [Heligmosomoides polygyrus]
MCMFSSPLPGCFQWHSRRDRRHHHFFLAFNPTGYHYDVLSCNGCKTFFRRTIINNRKFSCSKGGICQFNKDYRCACRACRFAKCIRVGMNAKGIQFPNRIRYTNQQEENDSFANISEVESAQGCSVAEVTILPQGKELIRQALACAQLGHYQENPIKFWMVADLFLAVEYAKTFKCFTNLCEADQVKILGHAGGLIQIASQAFYTLDQKEESLTFPDGINALRLQLKNRLDKRQRFQFEKYYRETYSRPVAVVRSLSMTREQFALFKAILLFSPNLTSSGLSEIELERERLTFILRKVRGCYFVLMLMCIMASDSHSKSLVCTRNA